MIKPRTFKQQLQQKQKARLAVVMRGAGDSDAMSETRAPVEDGFAETGV
jgi:hypothetical protein